MLRNQGCILITELQHLSQVLGNKHAHAEDAKQNLQHVQKMTTCTEEGSLTAQTSPMMANKRKADGQPSSVAKSGVKAIERTEPALKHPYKMDMARPLFSAGTHLQAAFAVSNPDQCFSYPNHSHQHQQAQN